MVQPRHLDDFLLRAQPAENLALHLGVGDLRFHALEEQVALEKHIVAQGACRLPAAHILCRPLPILADLRTGWKAPRLLPCSARLT